MKDKTEVKLSRQRRWQLKMLEQKRCFICGKPSVTKHRCEYHKKVANEADAIYRKKKKQAKKGIILRPEIHRTTGTICNI